MYGRISMGQLVGVIILSLLFVTPIYWIAISSGVIKIEKPYLKEYQFCEQELDRCARAKTPSCSPCESTKDRGYWFFFILGLIVYAGSLGYMVWNNKRMDKKDEELKKREEQVTKDEANLYKRLHPTKKKKR